MSTPHNSARPGEIAKTVLMPGDPLRAEFIAKEYLTDSVCFNRVRGMFGFTGNYKGKSVSVMGSGMGIPSMGIYSMELFTHYDVDHIIRIGTCGAVSEKVALRDLVFAQASCTNSNYPNQYGLSGSFAPVADFALLETAVANARKLAVPYHVGNLFCSDIFYDGDESVLQKYAKMGILAVEMESAALYCNAAAAGKKALCMASASDCPLRGESLSSEERRTSFTQMMEVALETAIQLESNPL